MVDPQVSCPIVCGEHMRASGFFYQSKENIYIVTARHNVLPTNGSALASGEISMSFQTSNTPPEIDVYLKTDSGYASKRVNINEKSGMMRSPKLDAVAVPVDFNPSEYGYQIWSADEVTSPIRTTDTLDVIGFTGKQFPSKNKQYTRELYESKIGRPGIFTLENEYVEKESDLSRSGLFASGIDEEFVGDDNQYNGLSGAPVIGDGLVGIHSQNVRPPKEAASQFDDEFMICNYVRARVLPKVL